MKLAIKYEDLESEAAPKLAGEGIADVVSLFIPYLFAISLIALLLVLLAGGLGLMTSAGDPKKVQAAWSKITNAVIGFVIVFLAYWLVQIVGQVLGIDAIKQIFS